MELRGKAKDDFEKWLISFFREKRTDYNNLFTDESILRKFYRKTDVEKNTLIIEFFDSVGIFINTPPYYMKVEKYNRGFESIVIDEKSGKIYDLDNDEDVFNSRQEAKNEAIKKANEIYNDKY